MDIEYLLDEEINDQFKGLSGIEIGSDSYKTTVDGLTKLIDRSIELKKIESEREFKEESRAIDTRLKNRQLMDEKLNNWVRNGLTAAGLIVTTGLTVWGTVKTFKFEEDGTITSTIGRGFVNKLLPRK